MVFLINDAESIEYHYGKNKNTSKNNEQFWIDHLQRKFDTCQHMKMCSMLVTQKMQIIAIMR